MSSIVLHKKVSLPEMVQTSKDLKKEIQQITSMDEKALGQFAVRIMALRQDLDEYEIKNSTKMFNREELRQYGICQNNLNKSQSIMFKKSIEVIEKNNPLDLYRCIENVWEKTTNEEIKDPGLGKRLLEKKKKDPFLLAALCEHLSNQKNQHFLEAVHSHQLSQFSTGSKPHFHHVVTLLYHDCLEACQKEGLESLFLYQLTSQIEKETGSDFDSDCLAEFLQLNMKHPCVVETVYKCFLDERLRIFDEFLQDANWEGAKSQFRLMPDSIKDAISQKIGSLALNTDDREKALIAGRRILDQCLSQQLFSISFKQALALEIEEMEGRISACQKRENGPDFIWEPPLFYSISTVVDNENNLSPSLKANLRWAFEGLSYAARKIPYSSNYLKRENTSYFSSNRTLTLSEKIREMLKSSRGYLVAAADFQKQEKIAGVLDNKFTQAIAFAKVAERYPVGNCDELSSTVFAYLTKQTKDFDLNIEIFSIQGNKGDHLFVVIGRDKTSFPENYLDFGPDAVICDPWARKIYPASLLEHLLNDFTGIVVKGLPGRRKFDPKRQTLHLNTSNVLTLNQFQEAKAKFAIEKESEVEDLLKDFHGTKETNERKSMAIKILELLIPQAPEKPMNSPVTVLLAQMHYFLHGKVKDPQLAV